jgi:RNA polymerase sigma-70 factor, ECF subfamily
VVEMPEPSPGGDPMSRPKGTDRQSSASGGRLYRYRPRLRATASDHQRFLDLTMPHLDTVHHVALGLTRDPQRAEDLVQETYLRAFAAFSQYRGGSLRAWMVSICLNTGRSDLRRARRRPDEDLSSDAAERFESGADPAIDAVRRLSVMAALARLSEEQRISVVLCDMAGLTAQEAADLLGCPRGTVLARVHRGRRRLAELLERKGVRDDV